MQSSKVESSKSRIAKIALANNCKVIKSFTNFVAIDCCENADYAKKVLESLIKQGVFVRMPYSFPQNRCIRVTAGLDKDIDLFEKAFPIALAESKWLYFYYINLLFILTLIIVKNYLKIWYFLVLIKYKGINMCLLFCIEKQKIIFIWIYVS